MFVVRQSHIIVYQVILTGSRVSLCGIRKDHGIVNMYKNGPFVLYFAIYAPM